VRTFAREIGVDVRSVQGSGPGGRIDIEDVKRHARERGSGTTAPAGRELPALPDFAQFGPVEREPLSRFRRTVARNMTMTWSQVPLVTLFGTADTHAFEAIRRRHREAASKAGGTITDGVLLMKIVGAGLEQFPHFNASYDEAAQELIVKRYVHIGLAVESERGLVVPVVRDVNKKNIVELGVDFRGIADRVKGNSLTLEGMRGASFTISSLETLGVSHFTPLVNWPEVAILGIGRDADLPSYEREELRVHKRIALSLSFDHRVVDGADGARFLRWLVNAIHEPTMLEVEGRSS
jgi:pyruvate dehydrogenase E2 component (dihydrolipoamide acetyltransferase)